jgi:MFS family permease
VFYLRAIGRAYQQAFQGLPREVWYLAIVMLINRSGSMVLPFLAIYVNTELGFTASAAGMMVVAFGLGSTLGTYLGGVFTEKFGAFRVQILSLIFTGVGFGSLSRMTSYWAFAITLFLLSVASDSMRPANGTALTLLCPKELHKRAFALNRLAINLGMAIGPAIGGWLATVNYQWLFWLDAITCLLAAFALWWLFGTKTPERETARSSSTIAGQSPWSDRTFLIFILLSIPTFAVFFQLIATYPLFLRNEYKFAEWQIGLLFALNTIIVVMFEMLIVHHLDRFRPLQVLAWGSFFMCEGFAILCFGKGAVLAIVSVLVYTLGEMLAMPQGMAFAASRSDEQSRPRFIGLYTMSISISFVVGPIIGSWMYAFDHWLFWKVSLAIGVLVLLGYHALDYSSPKYESKHIKVEDALTTSTD